MAKNNALPPASQPWVRELEKKVADLEKKLATTTRRVTKNAPKQDINLESLQVGELRVGGTGMETAVVTDSPVGLGWTKVVGADRVTFTSLVPDFDMAVGQILEWRMAVTATVDYAQYTDSLSEPYEAPADPDGALAGEETEFSASFTYRIDDPTDELYEPVPTEFSFTLINPTGDPIDATVHSSTLNQVTPGSGGVTITPGGEVVIEDGAGNSRPFNEITPEEAQAIQETAENLAQAQQDLEDARTEAQQNFEELDDKLTIFETGWPSGVIEGAHGFLVEWEALGEGRVRFTHFDTGVPTSESWNFWNVDDVEGGTVGGGSGQAFNVSEVVVRRDTVGVIEFETTNYGQVYGSVEVTQAMLAIKPPVSLAGLAAGTDLESVPIEKLVVADTGIFGETVSESVWANLAVVNRLQAETGWVGGVNLADGSVTSRTLNVVPESGTGGVEILPPGIRIIPSEAEAGTAVSLRVDEPNWISFAQDGVTTFSVSPEGGVVAQDIFANTSLQYRGEELSEILDQFPRGVLAHTRNSSNAVVGTSTARLLMASFRTPPENRTVRITLRFHGGTGSPRGFMTLRQSTGTSVKATNSSVAGFYVPGYESGHSHSQVMELVRTVDELGWPYDQTITMGGFIYSLDAGKTFNFTAGNDQEMVIEDIGPAVSIVDHTPYVPSGGGGTGGGNEDAPATRPYTSNVGASSFRTFPNTGTRHIRADQSVVQGYIAGVHSYGHWYFPSVTSTLNGASNMSGTLTITNQHTGSSAGMTIGLWAHNYASNPGSFGTAAKVADIHVGRGQTKTITLPANVLNGLKGGTIKGFGLSHGTNTSLNWYGYFSPTATLRLNYTK